MRGAGYRYQATAVRLAAKFLAAEGAISSRMGARRALIYAWLPGGQVNEEQLEAHLDDEEEV